MQIFDRYIGRAVMSGVLAAFSVIISIYILSGFAREMSEVGKANYTIWQAILYVLLGVPEKVYELFPMIAVLGTMLGLGMLASHHELTVIRTAGVSVSRIVGSVMKTALLLTVFAVFLGEVIGPPAVQYAKLNRVRAMEAKISLNTDYGLWARDGNTYIHVRRVEHDGRLIGVNLYVFDEYHSLQEIYQAKTGEFQDDAWQLQNGVQKKFTAAGMTTSTFKTMRWETLLKPDVVNVVSVTPDDLSVWKLLGYIDYLKKNGLDASHYQLTFWVKIFVPFTICAMMLIAVPFIFGTMRDVGVGQRVFVGFVIGLAFFIFSRLSAQLGLVYEWPPVIAASAPTLLVLALGGFLVTRIR